MPAGLFRRDYLLNEALDLIGQRLHGRCWTGQELFARKVDPPELIQAQRKPIEAAAQANQELSESLGAENMRTVDDTLPEAMQAELQLCASTSEA